MDRILPFLGIGVLFVFLVVGLVFISYLLVWGVVLGLVLYAVAWIKARFFDQKEDPHKTLYHRPYQRGSGEKAGRTFDND